MLTLLTEHDVSKQLRVSLGSLRRWRMIRRGPPFFKVGPLVRYRPEDVEAWLSALPTGGSPVPEESRNRPLVSITEAVSEYIHAAIRDQTVHVLAWEAFVQGACGAFRVRADSGDRSREWKARRAAKGQRQEAVEERR
jgi:hypothetical protein